MQGAAPRLRSHKRSTYPFRHDRLRNVTAERLSYPARPRVGRPTSSSRCRSRASRSSSCAERSLTRSSLSCRRLSSAYFAARDERGTREHPMKRWAYIAHRSFSSLRHQEINAHMKRAAVSSHSRCFAPKVSFSLSSLFPQQSPDSIVSPRRTHYPRQNQPTAAVRCGAVLAPKNLHRRRNKNNGPTKTARAFELQV